MKINSIGTEARANIKGKKKTVNGGGFHTLLKSNLSKITVHGKEGREQAGEEKQPERETAMLIKDAAYMLNRAMEQIHDNGEPDPAVVKSLQLLSHRLDQTGSHTVSEERQSADVLVAVEAQRLRNW